MGLKNFLKENGFIEDDSEKTTQSSNSNSTKTYNNVMPEYFPTQDMTSNSADQNDPSFVTPLSSNNSKKPETLDPSFIKFFEDEILKANLPGPDYFEFRQLLAKTQQKMAAKGNSAPEVVLQAVILSFEAQDIIPSKLIEAAKKYKSIIKQKNEDFLKGAETEKNNQLQKRENVLQQHNDNINDIQNQLKELEIQSQNLTESLNKEKTQLEVDKTLGKEGIEKIEKAEKLISLAHNYIQSTIDADIKRLQSL